MYSNPSTCCSPGSLRVYDRAPANYPDQTVQAHTEPVRDISCDQCILCAHIDTFCPRLENVTMCPVQGRSLMKRVLAVIVAPVCIEYRTNSGRRSVDGFIELPVDLLVRVPECAPYELRVLIDKATVHTGEYCGSGRFALRVTVCAALFVVVQSPCCGTMCPPKPVCPPLYPPCPPPGRPDDCMKPCPIPGPCPERPRDDCNRRPLCPPRPCRPDDCCDLCPPRPKSRMPYRDRRSDCCKPHPPHCDCGCNKKPLPWLGPPQDCWNERNERPYPPVPRPWIRQEAINSTYYPEYQVLQELPLFPPG